MSLSKTRIIEVGPPPFWFDELGYPLKPAPTPEDVERVFYRCAFCGDEREMTPREGGIDEAIFDWTLQHDTVVTRATFHTTAAQLRMDALRKARSTFSGVLALRVLGELVGLEPVPRQAITWRRRSLPPVEGGQAQPWTCAPTWVPALTPFGTPMAHRVAVRRMRDWTDWWGLGWLPRCFPADLDAPSVLREAMGRVHEPARSLLLTGGRYFDLLMRLCATDAQRAQALWMGGFDHTPTPIEGYARVVQLGFLPVPGPPGAAGYVDLRAA